MEALLLQWARAPEGMCTGRRLGGPSPRLAVLLLLPAELARTPSGWVGWGSQEAVVCNQPPHLKETRLLFPGTGLWLGLTAGLL